MLEDATQKIWLGTVKLNCKVSSPWQLSCQVLPTAPKFSMACHGSGSRSHFPPPSAAQRLSVSSSRSGRCFGIMIPCFSLPAMVRPKMTVAAHISCQHLVTLSASSRYRSDCTAGRCPNRGSERASGARRRKSFFIDERPTVIALVPSSISSHGVGVNALTTGR